MTAQGVGLIGIGLLGSAIAERLLGAGYPVLGYDTDAGCRERLCQQGGRTADSAAEVLTSCLRVVVSLPDSRVVAQVVRACESQLVPGTCLIDTTTGDPDDMQELGSWLRERQVAYLDATVAGSSEQMRRGEAVLMIGGEEAARLGCQDLLLALSPRLFPVGPCGSGARMKLIVNLVLGLNRAVLAEGLHLARCCGLDLHSVLDVLRAGPAYSAVMDLKGPRMITGDFRPQARLSQHHKDVQLIQTLGARQHAALPLTQVHAELLARAERQGWGAEDNSAISKVWGILSAAEGWSEDPGR